MCAVVSFDGAAHSNFGALAMHHERRRIIATLQALLSSCAVFSSQRAVCDAARRAVTKRRQLNALQLNSAWHQ